MKNIFSDSIYNIMLFQRLHVIKVFTVLLFFTMVQLPRPPCSSVHDCEEMSEAVSRSWNGPHQINVQMSEPSGRDGESLHVPENCGTPNKTCSVHAWRSTQQTWVTCQASRTWGRQTYCQVSLQPHRILSHHSLQWTMLRWHVHRKCVEVWKRCRTALHYESRRCMWTVEGASLLCDVSTGVPRPLVHTSAVLTLAHLGKRATKR